jgi:hypothetical protein
MARLLNASNRLSFSFKDSEISRNALLAVWNTVSGGWAFFSKRRTFSSFFLGDSVFDESVVKGVLRIEWGTLKKGQNGYSETNAKVERTSLAITCFATVLINDIQSRTATLSSRCISGEEGQGDDVGLAPVLIARIFRCNVSDVGSDMIGKLMDPVLNISLQVDLPCSCISCDLLYSYSYNLDSSLNTRV